MASSKKPGLYANIHAKQERIAHGSGETMRQPGSAGAPKDEQFKKAEKTSQATKTATRSAAAKKGAAKKAAAKRTAPKTTAAKKSAAKKTATKKTATKKTTTRKAASKKAAPT